MPAAQGTKIKVPNFKLILTEEDKAFILAQTREVLESHRWTVGPKGEAFEEAFRKYTGASHAVALSNGGVALITLLQALKVPEESIVICPTLTAPPTPHAILASNRRVVFVDSNPSDLGMDPADLEKKLKHYKGNFGAVITVHVGGWISPNIKSIKKLCDRAGIPLIEDCAHAHGSWFEGRHAGSVSGYGAYSFFMTKPLTCGEGGIVTFEDPSLVRIIKTIRNYGKDETGKHIMKGFNYKLSEFDAAVALWASLNGQRLAEERRKIARNYDRLLENVPGLSILNVPECQSSYYKYVVTIDGAVDRDKLKKILLEDHGIEIAGGVYDTLCHEEPYFRTLPDRILNLADSFPKAGQFARTQLCLPLYPGLKEEEQNLVAEALRRALA